MNTANNINEELTNAIIKMATESWRFAHVFAKAASKLDAKDQTRYVGQLNWFLKQTEMALETANLRIVNVEGQEYNAGIAATAINIEDFDSEETLLVEQMVEPIIMGLNGIVKTGTIILRGEKQ